MWSGFVGSFSKDCGFIVIAICFKRAEECTQIENAKTDGKTSETSDGRTVSVNIIHNIDQFTIKQL